MTHKKQNDCFLKTALGGEPVLVVPDSLFSHCAVSVGPKLQNMVTVSRVVITGNKTVSLMKMVTAVCGGIKTVRLEIIC